MAAHLDGGFACKESLSTSALHNQLKAAMDVCVSTRKCSQGIVALSRALDCAAFCLSFSPLLSIFPMLLRLVRELAWLVCAADNSASYHRLVLQERDTHSKLEANRLSFILSHCINMHTHTHTRTHTHTHTHLHYYTRVSAHTQICNRVYRILSRERALARANKICKRGCWHRRAYASGASASKQFSRIPHTNTEKPGLSSKSTSNRCCASKGWKAMRHWTI